MKANRIQLVVQETIKIPNFKQPTPEQNWAYLDFILENIWERQAARVAYRYNQIERGGA